MPEFPCPGPITVDARLAAGSVELHAEPRETALVEVAPYDDRDASREAAAQTRVDFSGDTLTIAAPEASGWQRRSPRLRVSARVPEASGARIRVASADAACDGEWSEINLTTAAGDVRLDRITGDLTVTTASGDVRAVSVGGQLTVHTASGDVSARQVAGALEVKTASGDVRVDDAGSDVDLKTASGDVAIGAARHGTVRANSVSGSVSVGVVAGTGVWLDVNTVSGKTRTDLNVGGEPPSSHDLTVQVRTVSGNVDIHRVTLPTPA